MKRRQFIGFAATVGTVLIVPSVLTACDDNVASQAIDLADLNLPNKPNRITSTLKGDTQTSRAFNWFTEKPAENPLVLISTTPDMANPIEFKARTKEVDSYYLTRNADGYFVFKATNKTTGASREFTDQEKKIGWSPRREITSDEILDYNITTVKEYIHSVEAVRLQPNTTYYYRVGSKYGAKSVVGKFKTAGQAKQAFSFIQYTDTQNAYYNEHIRNEALFCADTLKQAQITAPNAEFILHTGDFVEYAEVEDEWVDLMHQSQASFLTMSLAVAAGNHDEYPLSPKRSIEQFKHTFNNHLNLDSAGEINGGSYYSFNYNSAHFIVLNTNDNKKSADNPSQKALGKKQLTWLEADVKQARANGAKWIILSYHKPLFSKSYHSLSDNDVQLVRAEFMQLIDRLDIDLGLQGHDHVFSRTKALQFEQNQQLSFVYSKVDACLSEDGKVYQSPQGTVFIVPNTSGTKAYDAIFNKPLAHIHAVRPNLKNMTQVQLDHYNDLFAQGYQPQKSEVFAQSHSNIRDSDIQTFAVYTIDGNVLRGEIYMVKGDLTAAESRKVERVDSFEIRK